MAFKFKFNKKEASVEAVFGGNDDYIEKSGCYNSEITEAEIKEYDSGSEAIILNYKNENGEKGQSKIFYLKKGGEEVSFNLRKLMHLVGLTKTEKAMDKGAEALCEALKGKSVGIFLKVTDQKDSDIYKDREIEGFYDIKNNKTFKEKEMKEDAKVYGIKVKQYSQEVKEKVNEETEEEVPVFKAKKSKKVEEIENEDLIEEEEDDDEEFPF